MTRYHYYYVYFMTINYPLTFCTFIGLFHIICPNSYLQSYDHHIYKFAPLTFLITFPDFLSLKNKRGILYASCRTCPEARIPFSPNSPDTLSYVFFGVSMYLSFLWHWYLLCGSLTMFQHRILKAIFMGMQANRKEFPWAIRSIHL